MRESVFLHNIKKKYKNVDTSEINVKATHLESLYQYSALNISFLASLICMLVGTSLFLCCSYIIMNETSNFEATSDDILPLIIFSLIFELIAWSIKGYSVKTIWNMINSSYSELSVFLRLEGISYAIYIPAFIIFYILEVILGIYLASLAFGFFILFRQFLLYTSYKRNLSSRFEDRIILLLVGIGTYTFLLSIPFLFFYNLRSAILHFYLNGVILLDAILYFTLGTLTGISLMVLGLSYYFTFCKKRQEPVLTQQSSNNYM